MAPIFPETRRKHCFTTAIFFIMLRSWVFHEKVKRREYDLLRSVMKTESLHQKIKQLRPDKRAVQQLSVLRDWSWRQGGWGQRCCNTLACIDHVEPVNSTGASVFSRFSLFFFRWLLKCRAAWRCCLTFGMCTGLQVRVTHISSLHTSCSQYCEILHGGPQKPVLLWSYDSYDSFVSTDTLVCRMNRGTFI